MPKIAVLLLVCLNFILGPVALAADKLVLDLEMDKDLLSLSHNIDNFLFSPTKNYLEPGIQVINDLSMYDVLKNQLVATALVRINGKVVGIATEQEVLFADPESGHPLANSMWMLRLNEPGLQGFLVVNQIEDPRQVFSMVEKVMQSPDQIWEDEMKLYLSTSGETRVRAAYGDLAVYQGGIFQEYNGLNPSDYAKFKRFRATIQFVIYPKE